MSIDTISYATGESALGRVLVARSISGVCAILRICAPVQILGRVIGRDIVVMQDQRTSEWSWADECLRDEPVHELLSRAARRVGEHYVFMPSRH